MAPFCARSSRKRGAGSLRRKTTVFSSGALPDARRAHLTRKRLGAFSMHKKRRPTPTGRSVQTDAETQSKSPARAGLRRPTAGHRAGERIPQAVRGNPAVLRARHRYRTVGRNLVRPSKTLASTVASLSWSGANCGSSVWGAAGMVARQPLRLLCVAQASAKTAGRRKQDGSSFTIRIPKLPS
jgi:hypothetical protein